MRVGFECGVRKGKEDEQYVDQYKWKFGKVC